MQILPVNVARMRNWIYFKDAAVVFKRFGVAMIFFKEKVAVVLILERDECVANEMSEVEEETVVRSEMLIENYSAVIEEIHSFGN